MNKQKDDIDWEDYYSNRWFSTKKKHGPKSTLTEDICYCIFFLIIIYAAIKG